MPTEATRSTAAASLRDLAHSFAAHEPDDDVLVAITEAASALTGGSTTPPARDRLKLMRRGFEDRPWASASRTVPSAARRTRRGRLVEVRYDGDEIVADVVLRRAFEGAPGRAHGGIVAAAFDDVTGFVIAQLQEPAFTGELTVRYLAPVPVDEPLELRDPTRRARAPQALHQR